MTCSVILESLIYYSGCFFSCPVTCLVCSAGKVVSGFVVPFSIVFVVSVVEIKEGAEFAK